MATLYVSPWPTQPQLQILRKVPQLQANNSGNSGASAARKGQTRIWFVANIQRILSTLRLENWQAIKAKLSCLWWVEMIHEKMYRAVFDEVVVLNTVLRGYPEGYALDSQNT